MMRASARRGVTLIEILVVIAIISVVTIGLVAGSHQLPSARLKRSATLLAGAVKVAFTRATAVSRPERLVFDFDEGAVWLEESDTDVLVQKNDKTGTGGAEAETDAERAAVAKALEETQTFIKGPTAPRPRFKKVDALSERDVRDKKGVRMLPDGIIFREVITPHDATPATSGHGYLYFWPEGMTERAVIQLQIKGDRSDSAVLSVQVSPLTGRVHVKSGPFEFPTVGNDSLSEREDPGW